MLETEYKLFVLDMNTWNIKQKNRIMALNNS